MSLGCASRRLVACQLSTVPKRFLSGQGSAALSKFQSALEEYRLQNYAQETPRRFKKEILRAVVVAGGSSSSEDNTEFITSAALERVLSNIGALNKITHEEMELVLEEFGQSGYITAERLIMIM